MVIYKAVLSARVMATHEAPRVEVPKPHTFSGKYDAMAVTESLMDYKESMSSNDEGSRVSHSSSGRGVPQGFRRRLQHGWGRRGAP